MRDAKDNRVMSHVRAKRGEDPRRAGPAGRRGALLAAILATAPVAVPLASPAAAQQAPSPSLAIPLVGVLGQATATPAAGEAPAGGRIVLPAATAAAPTPAATPVAAATPVPAAAPAQDPAAAPAAGAPLAPAAIALPGPRAAAAAAPAATDPQAAGAPTPKPAPQALAPVWPVDASRIARGRAVLRGERDAAEFALFALPGAAPREIALSVVSSAFILPGRSALRLYVGDALVGERPLSSITEFETVTFPLPAGAIQPGLNRIRVETALAHRLYCGAEASYGLWTEIELARSGAPTPAEFVAAAPPGPDAFLAAASAARARGLPVLVKGAEGPLEAAPALTAAAARLGAALGGGLRFARAGVSDDPAAPMIEIRAGETAAAGFLRDASGRQVLVLTDGPGALPAPFGQARGLAAEAPLLPVDAATPLAALDFQPARVVEHLWTDAVAFRLPEDWLMNVKDRATLLLDYGYLTGMAAGSELRIRVNGDAVRILPLDRGGRVADEPLEVRFDAGLLRAGRNLLQFEAVAPGSPPDQPCLPGDVARLEIRETSTLLAPSAPRMHLPGLGRWIDDPLPLEIETLPAGAPTGLSARLALAAELPGAEGAAAAAAAEAAGATADRRRLVVLRPSELSSASFGAFGVGRQHMIVAVQPRRRDAAPDEGPQPASGPRVTPDVHAAGLFGDAPGAFAEVVARLATGARRLAAPDPVGDLTDWLAGTRAQALLFQLDPETPGDAYLLISDEARPDAVAAALGRAARMGLPLDGHLAALTWDGEWRSWTDTTRLPVLEEEIGGNWRGVLGNFASARPRLFVAAIVAIAFVSVLLANSYISASRRQR